MLLAVDVGNTNITFGLYDGEDLKNNWRLESIRTRTTDEYFILVVELLKAAGTRRDEITGSIMASVVPPLSRTIETMLTRLLSTPPLVVGPGIKTGISVRYNLPQDVGADRIVNAVAAFQRFQSACIVVDFGTATTFDVISARGDYLGGAICPGIELSLEALAQRAARLPRVDFAKPPHAIGRSTVESIQAGAFYGYAALVDGMVARIRKELEPDTARVVGTGGLAPLIAQDTTTIEEVYPELTLRGLRLIYTMNT